MRRVFAVALLSVLCFSLFAAPSLAQGRDPFEPQTGQIEPEPETEPGTEPNGEAEPEPEPEPEPQNGGLGDTGLETQPWLVLAYVLITVGIGAVVLGRVWSKQT